MEWRFEIDGNEVDEPIGWADMTVRIVRDKNWHGMFTQHSVEGLTFLCDAKDYIYNKYETEGIDSKLNLKIYYRCSPTDSWSTFFDGTMILSSLKLTEGANLANVSFEANKGEMSLRNRSDIDVNLNSELTQSRPPSTVNTIWTEQYFPAILDGDELKQTIYRRYRARLVMGCVGNMLGYDTVPMNIFHHWPFLNLVAYNPMASYPKYATVYFPTTGSGWSIYVAKFNGANNLATDFYNIGWGPMSFLRALYYIAYRLNPSMETNCPSRPFEQGCVAIHMPRILEENSNGIQFNIYVGIGGQTQINETPYDQVNVSSLNARLGFTIDEYYYYYDNGAVNNDDGSVTAHPTEDISNIFYVNENAEYNISISCEFKLCGVLWVFSRHDIFPGNNFHDYDEIKITLNLKIGSFVTTIWSNTYYSSHIPATFSEEFNNALFLNETINISYNNAHALTIGDIISLEFDFECKISYSTSTETRADFYGVIQTIPLSTNCCFEISYGSTQTIETRSLISVYPVYETFNRIVESVTDNLLKVRSDFFGRPGVGPQTVTEYGCGSMTAITNGYYIRGFGIETIGNSSAPPPSCDTALTPPSGDFTNVLFKKIFVTFNELYKAMDSIFAIGAGLEYIGGEWWVRIEERKYFYDDTTLLFTINLEDGILINYEIEVATDMVYNYYKSGYEVWESESINGLFEYNSMRNWRIPIFTIKNEYDSVCGFIGGSQTFEYTRRQAISISGTQDFKYDENKFVICIKEFNENNPTNISAEIYTIAERGLDTLSTFSNIRDEDEILNWRIRPAVMARRHLPWLAPSMFHDAYVTPWLNVAMGYANIEATGRDPDNALLASCPDWGVTSENEGISMTDVPPTYQNWFLRPEYHKLKIFLPIQDYLNIIANPRGMIRIINGSITKDCFIVELSYNPSIQEANFKLVVKN